MQNSSSWCKGNPGGYLLLYAKKAQQHDILVSRYGTGHSFNWSLWDFCQFIVHQMQNNKSDFLEMQNHTSPQTVRF